MAYDFEDGIAVVCDANDNWLEIDRNGVVLGPHHFS